MCKETTIVSKCIEKKKKEGKRLQTIVLQQQTNFLFIKNQNRYRAALPAPSSRRSFLGG